MNEEFDIHDFTRLPAYVVKVVAKNLLRNISNLVGLRIIVN